MVPTVQTVDFSSPTERFRRQIKIKQELADKSAATASERPFGESKEEMGAKPNGNLQQRDWDGPKGVKVTEYINIMRQKQTQVL